MQAPPKRDPLGPASKSQLNRRTSPAISGHKRKRTEDDDQSHASLLTATAVDPGVTPQTAVFTAIAPVNRADLPLAWIEQRSTSAALPVAHTVTCSHTSMRQLKSKHVMAARLNPNGRIYALESVKEGAFIAVLLSHWVTEEMVRSAARESRGHQGVPTLVTNDLPASRPHSRAGSTSSTTSFRFPTPSSPRKPTNKKGAMARAAILKPREQARASPATEVAEPSISLPSQLTELSPAESPLLQPIQPSVEALDGPATPVDGVPEPPLPKTDERSQNRPGTTESLHMQYLETLYLSRTSLAFFAKSSLARARAQLRDPESNITVEELKDLYDWAILPTKKMEKKYKESIPTLLKNQPSETKKRRKKTSNEPKLGKNCLYTGEEELLRKWWVQEISERAEVNEAETKKLISELRFRETEMQVLLVLEALVLQTTAAQVAPQSALPDSALIKSEPQEESLLNETPEQKSKKKKARNYLDELETLLERMCIWQAVTSDEFAESSRSDAGGADRLKSFCTDIAIPFYASKIPSYIKTVCKKLGGPSISPQRPKISRTSSSIRSSAAARSVQSKTSTKMSLQRVLSEDQDLRHATPPVLSRSASDKGRPSLKRAPSEIMSRPQSRAGLQKAVSFSNREVDLVADARTQEAKRRKLDKVAADKKQLQEAIQALKKPNRSSAAKEIMDEAEKRAAAKNAIQITATPRKIQRRTVLDEPEAVESLPPPDPVIPSSTMKPTLVGFPRASAQKRAVLSAIHDTPSRGSTKTSNPLNLGKGTSNCSLVAATPTTNRLRPDLPLETPTQTKMSRSGKLVLFTPLKRSDVTIEDAFRDAPEIPEKAGKAMDRVMGGKGFGDPLFSDSGIGSSGGRSRGKEDDIYAQLGWDDDFPGL